MIIGFCVDQVIGLSLPAYLLWDGRGLQRVVSEEKLEKGRLYQGDLNQDGEFCWLLKSELIEYPAASVTQNAGVDTDWEVNEVWYLQQDAADMLPFEQSVKRYLLASIDAIVSENETIAAIILVTLSKTPSFSLTNQRRSFYQELGIQLFDSCGFKYISNLSIRPDLRSAKGAESQIRQILSESNSFVAKLNSNYKIHINEMLKHLMARIVEC